MMSLMSIHHAGENYMQVQDPRVNLNTLLLLFFFKDILMWNETYGARCYL